MYLGAELKQSDDVNDLIPEVLFVGPNYLILFKSGQNIAYEFNDGTITAYLTTDTSNTTLIDIKAHDVLANVASSQGKSCRYVLSQD